jgi:low temperature requirement protein LtrA
LVLLITLSQAIPQLTQFLSSLLLLAYSLLTSQSSHLIEEKKTGQTGNLLIYLHYFILFGLSLITVSLKFISEKEANSLFAISCLYGGMLLFYIGITIAITFNMPQ